MRCCHRTAEEPKQKPLENDPKTSVAQRYSVRTKKTVLSALDEFQMNLEGKSGGEKEIFRKKQKLISHLFYYKLPVKVVPEYTNIFEQSMIMDLVWLVSYRRSSFLAQREGLTRTR